MKVTWLKADALFVVEFFGVIMNENNYFIEAIKKTYPGIEQDRPVTITEMIQIFKVAAILKKSSDHQNNTPKRCPNNEIPCDLVETF